MAASVSSGIARLRRIAGWWLAVGERFADLVFVAGGALVLIMATALWGLASFTALSDVQETTIRTALGVLLVGWLLALAILHQKGWLRVCGPLLFYDLIRIARRTRYFLLRLLYALLLGFMLCWLYVMLSVSGQKTALSASEMARFAESFFSTFVVVQFFVACLLTPAYTAGAIAEEKERRTLEFVLATDLRNREIVLSKLLSRLANLSLLILTGLPILGFLQFLGGVDPNLVVASFAATALTVVSLAALSLFNSVLTRRARDAIALTYLGAVGYLLLSGAAWILLNPDWQLASWPSPDSPITLEDAVHGFSAGNPIAAVIQLVAEAEKGRRIDEVLPRLLGGYALFHGCLTVLCCSWAVLRLRGIALRQAQGETRKTSTRRALWRRPSVGSYPMVWKEIFAERGLRLHLAAKIFVGILLIASFVPVGFIFAELLGEFGSGRTVSGASFWDGLASGMNVWVRVLGSLVACLLLLGVAARAASSVSNERDRQTLDGLLTSPLEGNAILFGKWLGSILSVRWGWLWLGAIYGLGLLTGGLELGGLLAILIAWFIYAGVVSAIGLWFSIVSRTTLRATVLTLLSTVGAGVGHWLLWVCCAPLLFGGHDGELVRWLLSFQLGMTPPATLGYAFAFSAHDWDAATGMAKEMKEAIGFAVLGLIIWLLITGTLWAACCQRFRVVTGREAPVPPRSRPGPERLHSESFKAANPAG